MGTFDLDFWLDTALSFFTIYVLGALLIKGLKYLRTKIVKQQQFHTNKNNILTAEENECVELANRIYEQNKAEFDKARKKYFYTISITTTFLSILAYKLSSNFYNEKLFEKFLPSVKFWSSILVILTIFVWIFRSSTYKYKGIFGRLCVDKFLSYGKFRFKYYPDWFIFNKQTNYNGNKNIEMLNAYKKANFFNLPKSQSELKDCLVGSFSDTTINLCDANFSTYDSNKTPSTQYLFHGNFTIIDLSPNIQAKLVSKDIEDDTFSNENNSSDFDLYFSLTGPEGENPNDYFTDEFKNFLVEFIKKYKIRFDIIIKDKIYIQFHTKNMFSTMLVGNPITPNTIYQYTVITKLLEEIINHTKGFTD